MAKITNVHTGESWEHTETQPDLELRIWVTPFRFIGHLEFADLKAEIEFELREPLIMRDVTLDNLYKGFFDMLLMAGSNASGGKDA